MPKPSLQRRCFAIGALLLFVFLAVITAWLLPKPSAAPPDQPEQYPVQGFDISHHQGEIAWNKIPSHRYQFVLIKATEGGDYQDPKFQENWLKARERGFVVGAYHFYRLCREGHIQAENFIATVPVKADVLPPVIDLEYDEKCIHHYTQEQLLQQIEIMVHRLEQHYHQQPIFYTSKAFYNIVLADHAPKNLLWIREYHGQPTLRGNPNWSFWQYTAKGKIAGIASPVDLNVFAGDLEQWQAFRRQSQPTAAP